MSCSWCTRFFSSTKVQKEEHDHQKKRASRRTTGHIQLRWTHQYRALNPQYVRQAPQQNIMGFNPRIYVRQDELINRMSLKPFGEICVRPRGIHFSDQVKLHFRLWMEILFSSAEQGRAEDLTHATSFVECPYGPSPAPMFDRPKGPYTGTVSWALCLVAWGGVCPSLFMFTSPPSVNVFLLTEKKD